MESVEAMVQDKVKEAMKEAQASLLGAFDQLMSAKLDSVQNKIIKTVGKSNCKNSI